MIQLQYFPAQWLLSQFSNTISSLMPRKQEESFSCLCKLNHRVWNRMIFFRYLIFYLTDLLEHCWGQTNQRTTEKGFSIKWEPVRGGMGRKRERRILVHGTTSPQHCSVRSDKILAFVTTYLELEGIMSIDLSQMKK